jgi:hypothetical protein
MEIPDLSGFPLINGNISQCNKKDSVKNTIALS